MSAPTSRSVVVLLGTDHHQFERMVAWAESHAGRFPDDRVLVQHGRSRKPRIGTGIDFMGQEDLRGHLAAADVVVCHGGPGTIADARSEQHRPLVMPRDPRLGEHVDSHQQRFVRFAEGHELVHACAEPADLDVAVAALPATGTREERDIESTTAQSTRLLEQKLATLSPPRPGLARRGLRALFWGSVGRG